MEHQEPRMKTPPLNTALAAGNAKVCLELLNRNADVLWKHEDGASALHVTCAWIASSHNAQLRLPPTGEEPRAVIAMMLHNGVDPTVTEGMSKGAMRSEGMTPLESFRREIARSPWRQDPSVGPKFDKTAQTVHVLLEQGETAVKRKNEGNKVFKDTKYKEAIVKYAEARKIWEAADIRGHHMAVLWSNEATCHKKLEDWGACIKACDEGLTHYTTEKIRKKLEEAKTEAITEEEKIARGEVKEKPAPAPRKPATKLDGGYFKDEESAPKAEFYPNGSVQGGTGKSPGPYICGFNDALHAGFVDGCDGDKDKQKKEDQALDLELAREGYIDPDMLATSDNLDLINRVPRAELNEEQKQIEALKKRQETLRTQAVKNLRRATQTALHNNSKEGLWSSIEEARRAMVKPEDPVRVEAELLFEELREKELGTS
jgi:hypothetical protein